MASSPLGRFDAALQTIKDLARQHGDTAIVRESQWLADRVHAGELTVLVAGQFKRGKSTFINALLGEEWLPTGVLPLTSVATMIHFGNVPRATVSFRDGGSTVIAPSAISQYVTEAENPENRLRVARVDLELPVPLLEGLRLVDTPGIASTYRHNTEAAREALHEADLAILVVSPEPPIGAAEVAFAKEVRDAAERLFIVYNKADVLPEQERQLVDFTKMQLESVLGFVPRVFVISARSALRARKAGAEDERYRFFMGEFTGFLERHRDTVRERSMTRQCVALSRRLGTMLRLRRHALLLPLEERRSARRRFEVLSQEVRQHGDELQAQIAHAMRGGSERIDRFLDSKMAASRELLVRELSPFAAQGDPTTFERELEHAAAREAGAWLAAICQTIDAQMREQAQSLLRRVAQLEEEILQRGLEVVHLVETIPSVAAEAFDLPGISLPKERIADTGLEIVVRGGIALLPRAVRARMLEARLTEAVRERLDARRGRLRYAARRELDRIARELAGSAQRRLVAAEGAVRAALTDDAAVDDAYVRSRSTKLEAEEQTVEHLASALEATLTDASVG